MITNLFIGKERYLYIIYHIQASLSILINFSRFSSDTFCPRSVRKSIGSLSSIFSFAIISSGIFPVSAAARSKKVYQSSEPFLILRQPAYSSSFSLLCGGGSNPRSNLLILPGSNPFSMQNCLSVFLLAILRALKNSPNNFLPSIFPSSFHVVLIIQHCNKKTTYFQEQRSHKDLLNF